jgi:hypothetical protein
MKLEVGTFPVRDIVFGAQTHWRDGVLTTQVSSPTLFEPDETELEGVS